jgi:hypothetical protein
MFPGTDVDTVVVTVTRTGTATPNVTLSLSGVPSGATSSVSSPGDAATGTITIGAGTAAAGTYTVTVTATDGTFDLTQSLAMKIGVKATVADTSAGTFKEAMSTSFQVASWNDSLFTTYPSIPAQLTTLGSKHIRMQVMGTDIPETADGVWDFTTLDKTVQPILTASDQSPEFQIAYAPTYLYGGLSSGFVDSTFLQGYADYSANLVRYYNTGGFTANSTTYASPSSTPITYWGIYNEPNYNGVTPAEYVEIYNKTVPEMLAVDPSLKIVALELGSSTTADPEYIPAFVSGVTAQVNVLAEHFYSTCQQLTTDQVVMDTIPGFVSEVNYMTTELATRSDLANVPIWVLENNVNADFATTGGMSMCNNSIKFVADPRGSDAFFAAWRPYVFSQLGKAGVQALYHWDYAADKQYGELNTDTGKLQLSYWVDYWLGQYFPASQTATVLSLTNTDSDNVEVLPVKRSDGSVLVMVANHAVASASDDDGAGAPRTVKLDLSSLGSFATAKQLTIDSSTDPVAGPSEQSVDYSSTMQLTMSGYGVTFLTLQ